MNIWCISKYAAPPKYSKMPARLFELVREFNDLGHNARLITSDSNHLANFPNKKNKYTDELIENVKVRWLKTIKYKKTSSMKRILSWLDFERRLFFMPTKTFEKPDIILISSLSIFSIIYGYYLKKKFNAFLVFEIRDIWPLTMTEEGGFSKWHPLVLLIGAIEKFGYKKTDLIVGTMPRLNLHVEKVIGYKKPFHCSPIGFNPKYYDNFSTVGNLKERFKRVIPKNRVVVGYAGSMGITNSLEMFIDTIESLKHNKNIYFVLVGSGDLKERFKNQLSKCKNVLFWPRIEQNEVNLFLNLCDILYLSTQHSKVWDYGQSMNKIVEYMLASKPIIANYTGYPSMINEANCGKFVNVSKFSLRDELLNITDMSIKERELIGYNGKKWIYTNRKYSALAKRYIEAIKTAKTNKTY